MVSKRHEEICFSGKNGAHINTNLASTEMRNVAIGVVCRLNFVNMILFVLGKQPGASFAMSKSVQRMRHAAWSASQSTLAVSYV